MPMVRLVPPATAVALTALVVALPLAAIHALAPPAAVPASQAPQVTVSPTTVAPGGKVTVKGRIAPAGRKVVLQRSTGGAWAKVAASKTKRRGAYTFTTAAPRSGPVRFRVTAPKAVIGGRTYPKVTTQASRQVTVASASPTTTATPSTTSTATPTATTTTQTPTPTPTTTSPPPPSFPQRIATLDDGSFDMSPDGRFVAFVSDATDLVAGDTNGFHDVFLLDRNAATFTRVSLTAAGAQASARSFSPRVSADGRYVVFTTNAKLTASDANTVSDVFVRDVVAGTTTLVSYDSGGQSMPGEPSSAPDISDDGRYVVFDSRAALVSGDENLAYDVFVRDMSSGALDRLTTGTGGPTKGGGTTPSISGDGNTVVYLSAANDLVAGDNGGYTQAYVQDRVSGARARVSRSGAGAAGDQGTFVVSVSADGQRIAFQSRAGNLVAGDTNMTDDVFTYERASGTIARISLRGDGGQANNASRFPAISADGTTVTYTSWASDLVASDTNGVPDVFVQDLATSARVLVSRSSAGALGNDISRDSVLDADGGLVLFGSNASNLVAGDTNGVRDLFLHALD